MVAISVAEEEAEWGVCVQHYEIPLTFGEVLSRSGRGCVCVQHYEIPLTFGEVLSHCKG